MKKQNKDLKFDSSFIPVNFIKTTVRHNLGYKPIIILYCERIGGDSEHPRFVFETGFISDVDFYFYHELYVKREFRFVAKVIKETIKTEEIDTYMV